MSRELFRSLLNHHVVCLHTFVSISRCCCIPLKRTFTLESLEQHQTRGPASSHHPRSLKPNLPLHPSQLYGLFKYLTTSSTPNTSRPGLLDFTGRAKWDAWSNIGKQFADRAPDVEARYLQIATELGFKAGEAPVAQEATTRPSEDGDFWDEDTASKSSGGPSGLGNSVSTVSHADEEEREQGSLHALAVSGDVQGLESYLQSHPGTELNEKDAYVRSLDIIELQLLTAM